MRWILFAVFVTLFCVVSVFTILSVFLHVGSPSDAEREVLFYLFVAEVGTAVTALFYYLFRLKRAQDGPTVDEAPSCAQVEGDKALETPASPVVGAVLNAGVSAFYESRRHYGIYRTDARTIDSYIGTAVESLVMVSINLVTGEQFDGLSSILEEKLEHRKHPITATISLLNPWKSELMYSLAPVLNRAPDELGGSIRTMLEHLLKLRERLSQDGKRRFTVGVHNTLPFGSAIILDENSSGGRIQIETKPYKQPLNRSFAFEVTRTDTSDFYDCLVRSYRQLVDDGENMSYIRQRLILESGS